MLQEAKSLKQNQINIVRKQNYLNTVTKFWLKVIMCDEACSDNFGCNVFLFFVMLRFIHKSLTSIQSIQFGVFSHKGISSKFVWLTIAWTNMFVIIWFIFWRITRACNIFRSSTVLCLHDPDASRDLLSIYWYFLKARLWKLLFLSRMAILWFKLLGMYQWLMITIHLKINICDKELSGMSFRLNFSKISLLYIWKKEYLKHENLSLYALIVCTDSL